MMEAKRGQHIQWKEPEVSTFPSNGLHSKVNRTYSVSLLGGHPPPPIPLSHHLMSISRRSSPDGSAAAVEAERPGHLSTTQAGHKQIDGRAFSTTAAAAAAADVSVRPSYDNYAKTKTEDEEEEIAVGRVGPSPQPVSPEPSTAPTAVTRPYLGQNEDNTAYALNRNVEPTSLLDLDAMYCPVASDSRGELLQCEGGSGGSLALEDVLRHYWLLSDRDDELPKSRERARSTASDYGATITSIDWSNSRPSDANSSPSSSSSNQTPTSSDWIARSPEIMLPLDCDDDDDDDDVDSVVTLSTISEENEADLNSDSSDDDSMVRRINENAGKSFRDSPRDVIGDNATDLNDDETDFDFLSSDKEDSDVESNHSAEVDTVNPIPEEKSGPIMPHLSPEIDLLPSSSSMMDSFVRSFSHYVSDIYPFSSGFVSQESNAVVAGEGNSSCRTESNPSMMSPTPDDVYTVTDTLVHIKLFSTMDETDFHRHKDQSTNTAAADEMVWSPNDARNSLTSPTSWYTVSDIFNSQSFETASEMAEDDLCEAALVSTANAKCTAVARCLVGQSSQPLELLPSATVSVRVTAADPFAAIGRAAARAASQATSRTVREFPTSDYDAGVVEIVVTTTCVLTGLNKLEVTDGNSDDVFLLKSDAAVEARSYSTDASTQSSITHTSYDYDDYGCTNEKTCNNCFPATSGKHFRRTPEILLFTEAPETEDGAVIEEWSSALDEAMQGNGPTCSVAIPWTGSDGNLRPQFDEATYLPTTAGAERNGGATQDFEVISVAVKEPAKKMDILLSPEETVRGKDGERTQNVVPFSMYTKLGQTKRLERDKFFENFHESDKKTEENFQDRFKHSSSCLDKQGGNRVAADNKDSLKIHNIQKLLPMNREELHSMKLNPVLDKSSTRFEPTINTCDDIPKNEIVIAADRKQSIEKNLVMVDTSSKSQQQVDKLENLTGSKALIPNDKNIDSLDGTTGLQDPETKNSSDVLRGTLPLTSRQPLVFEEKNPKRSKSHVRIRKSQSLLLETDIDTLEHRRTPVFRKGRSRASAMETKSCTDLSSTKVSHHKTHPIRFGSGRDDTLISKEALAELLSADSPSAGSFLKNQQNWGSSLPTTVGHCLSEPTLQPSPDNESTVSSSSTGNPNPDPGHLMDRLPSRAKWRMYRSQEAMSTRKQKPSSPNRRDIVRHIERYEQSPTLRRRSLHIIETLIQRRNSETMTVQSIQSSETPPLQNESSSDRRVAVARHSSSPAGSSFENLVDSLLGITAVMSMGAAVSQTRSSYVAIPSDELKPLGGGVKSPSNLHLTVSESSLTSSTQSDEKKTIGLETESEVCPATDQTTVSLGDSSGSSPVHAITTPVRKHVHFRKAKHIFRKCHFCIDANEHKGGPSSTPSKSPRHETTRHKTNGKKHH